MEFLEGFVVDAFGAEAVGGDVGDGFGEFVIKEGVAGGARGDFGFEAMAAVDVPGG